MKSERKVTLEQLNHLVDNFCNPCDVRQLYRGQITKIQNYCLHQCPIGEKLKSLGNHLLDISNREANNILSKGRAMTTKEVRYLINRGFSKEKINNYLNLNENELKKYFEKVVRGIEVANYQSKEKIK